MNTRPRTDPGSLTFACLQAVTFVVIVTAAAVAVLSVCGLWEWR